MTLRGLPKIPLVGLGSYSPGNAENFVNVLVYAIEEVGYRYIDTAHIYGSEELVGKALARVFAKGVIKREDVWITTKLWITNTKPDKVEPALRDSLKRLGLSYVDLFIVHWPCSLVHQSDGNLTPEGPDGAAPVDTSVDILDTWEALEKLVGLNLTRFVGVSNYSIEMLERMEFSPRVKIQPYVNQVELSLFFQQNALIQYCERRGIFVTAYSPLGQFSPNKTWGTNILNDPVVASVAKEIGKTPVQVALKFLLQLSPVVNVIPKADKNEYAFENFQLDFTLTPAHISVLKKRNTTDRVTGDYVLSTFGYDLFAVGVALPKRRK